MHSVLLEWIRLLLLTRDRVKNDLQCPSQEGASDGRFLQAS